MRAKKEKILLLGWVGWLVGEEAAVAVEHPDDDNFALYYCAD